MRVKTPWVEALTKSRDDAQAPKKAQPAGARDSLPPKRMADSFYKAVGFFPYNGLLEGGVGLIDCWVGSAAGAR